MTTAVADPVDPKAAPVAAAAAPPSAPAAGSPAGAGAGSGAGGAPAPASGEAPKSLLERALEAKPADAKPAETPAKAEAPKPDEWTLEAKDAPAEAVKAVQDFAKAEGMSKAQAEKLLARELAAEQGRAATQKAQLDQVANTLAKQVEDHPELGGQHLATTLENAKRTMVAAFTPDERKAILASPYANHPLLIKLLSFASKGLREDTIHSAPSTGEPIVDGAKLLYGDRARR